jgi:hypothetical protein
MAYFLDSTFYILWVKKSVKIKENKSCTVKKLQLKAIFTEIKDPDHILHMKS